MTCKYFGKNYTNDSLESGENHSSWLKDSSV